MSLGESSWVIERSMRVTAPPIVRASRNLLWQVRSLVAAGKANTAIIAPTARAASTAPALLLLPPPACEASFVGSAPPDHLKMHQKTRPASAPSAPRKPKV